MSLYDLIMHAIGLADVQAPQPAIAQLTIITSEPLERPSESRSPQSRD
jgi:hypothetical protein